MRLKFLFGSALICFGLVLGFFFNDIFISASNFLGISTRNMNDVLIGNIFQSSFSSPELINLFIGTRVIIWLSIIGGVVLIISGIIWRK